MSVLKLIDILRHSAVRQIALSFEGAKALERTHSPLANTFYYSFGFSLPTIKRTKVTFNRVIYVHFIQLKKYMMTSFPAPLINVCMSTI